MNGHFKPGSVVWLPNKKSIAVVDKRGRLVYGSGEFHHALPGSITAEGARSLVVIDPEDAEQIKRLADAYAKPQGLDEAGPNITAGMTVALRKYANPTPRIEEPPGLGAVVEDDRGCRWVKVDTAMSCDSWTEADAGMSDNPWRKFGSLNAVRVLSEGVPS